MGFGLSVWYIFFQHDITYMTFQLFFHFDLLYEHTEPQNIQKIPTQFLKMMYFLIVNNTKMLNEPI